MRNKISAETRATIIRMYVAEGLGTQSIAKAIDLGATSVHRILVGAKIACDRATRKRGRRGIRLHDDAVEKEIAEKYASGVSSSALRAQYGCSLDPIRTAIVKNGGTMGPRGNRLRDFSDEDVAKMTEMYKSGMSQTAICAQWGAAQGTIGRVLRFHGLKVKPRKSKGAWKGGRTISASGYIAVHVPASSPYASMRNTGGYVLEHRLVMAQKFGRPLTKNETVHHINGDRQDNRVENLEVRMGQHGTNVAMCCADCGSRNVIAAPLSTMS